MADRQIEYLPLEALKGDPRNPKSHDLALIDSSYSRFGVIDPVALDGRTGYIISGHGRTTTLKDSFAKGEPAPEGVRVTEDGTWLVPTYTGWASKNDAEAAAALISMNRVTEMGGWVDESLLELLDEISASGAGFEGVGYSETDLDDLRHLLEDVPDLDELADEWNEDDQAGASSGGNVSIKITDAAVIAEWHAQRDAVKTDDDAMRVILGMDPAPAPVKKGKSRTADVSFEDLPDVPEIAPAPANDLPDLAGAPVLDPAEEGAEPVTHFDGDPDEDEDEEPLPDNGLDWSTAETVTPEFAEIATGGLTTGLMPGGLNESNSVSGNYPTHDPDAVVEIDLSDAGE